jgi:preprotein translocase subunit SecY
VADEETYEGPVQHPNRDKPESKQTRAIVTFLLLVSAAILAVIAIGGWDKFQGAKPVTVFYILVYLLFAFYVSRWNRGVLPVATALSVILIIFAAVAAPAWFGRDKAGFDDPTLPESVLGLLTLVLIPVQALLIAFAMRGFRQQWNVEAGSRAAMDAGMGPPEPSAETRA